MVPVEIGSMKSSRSTQLVATFFKILRPNIKGVMLVWISSVRIVNTLITVIHRATFADDSVP